MALKVLSPNARLVITLSLLFRPSTAPPEIEPHASNQLDVELASRAALGQLDLRQRLPRAHAHRDLPGGARGGRHEQCNGDRSHVHEASADARRTASEPATDRAA